MCCRAMSERVMQRAGVTRSQGDALQQTRRGSTQAGLAGLMPWRGADVIVAKGGGMSRNCGMLWRGARS